MASYIDIHSWVVNMLYCYTLHILENRDYLSSWTGMNYAKLVTKKQRVYLSWAFGF